MRVKHLLIYLPNRVVCKSKLPKNPWDDVPYIGGMKEKPECFLLEMFKTIEISQTIGIFRITRRNVVARGCNCHRDVRKENSICIDVIEDGVQHLEILVSW